MGKQVRTRVVGAVPSRAATQPSEEIRESLARAQEHVNAIKGRKSVTRTRTARAS